MFNWCEAISLNTFIVHQGGVNFVSVKNTRRSADRSLFLVAKLLLSVSEVAVLSVNTISSLEVKTELCLVPFVLTVRWLRVQLLHNDTHSPLPRFAVAIFHFRQGCGPSCKDVV